MDKEAKKYLKQLCGTVAKGLDMIDVEMKKPSTEQRGKVIAEICNAIEMANDSAWHFGLGLSLKKGKYRQERDR